tara:strand:+ start:69 stop:344 length:276 start_codon:yes stop_codon:yes gene_type:complete
LVITYLDHPVFNPNLEGLNRLISRGFQYFPRSDVKTGAMTRALDHVVIQAAGGNLRTVVSADIFNSEILTSNIEHRDLNALKIDNVNIPRR